MAGHSKTTTVQVRFPKETWARVLAAAKAEERTAASLLRKIVSDYLRDK